MDETRELVLGRVRAALGAARTRPSAGGEATGEAAPRPTPAEPDAGPVEAGVGDQPAGPPPVDLLASRLSDYGAEVRRVSRRRVGAAVDDVCAARGAGRVGVPSRLPVAWRPRAVTVVADDDLTVTELDGLDGTVTGCTYAIAETGTLLLTAGPAEGRRALTLVPDLHVCVVEERQVVADVGAALAAVAPLVRDERRPLTFVSGPSATSDIELQRVEGVHGPRQLVVLIAGD